MAYNLIDEQWIPVERRSGTIEMIAPAQVVERDDPPLRIASARPDFDGALLEFLVGLVQTAAAPATERAWEKEFETPPSVEVMARRLRGVRDAFFLDGDGPRFMQDLTVADDERASDEPIGALLIDRIGESGLDESPSLFAKPGLYAALGYPAAAAALMALQTYAPAGGRGQLTSLRGGGPLTTLIVTDWLWETIWLNVLPRPEFEARVPGTASTDGAAVFPWLAKTRSAARGATPPKAVHPLQHLWGLPRRVRLRMDGGVGTCDVTGASGPVVRGYFNRPDGTDYDGAYRHPWTPYTMVKPTDPWNPKKGSADGLPYRDWPLLVTGSDKRAPAAVVSYFATTRRRERVPDARLAAFGYALDKMKPLRWCRAETPLVTVPPGLAGDFAGLVDALVAASEEVRKTLGGQVKAAWADGRSDIDAYSRVNPAFWSATEPHFYEAVHAVRRALEATDVPALLAARETWGAALHRCSLAVFDASVEAAPELGAGDLRRIIQARKALDHFTRPTNPKVRKLLGLPLEEAPAAGQAKRATQRKKEART